MVEWHVLANSNYDDCSPSSSSRLETSNSEFKICSIFGASSGSADRINSIINYDL